MSPAALPLPSPLSSEDGALLAQFAARAETASLLWASGYLAGLARALDAPAQPQVPAHPDAGVRTTVLYGSQTGNARRAAEALHARLEAAGLPARLLRADAYPLRELKDERLLYIAISTQGDGEPPDDALAFVEFLSGKRAPRLPQLKFAVLALGDVPFYPAPMTFQLQDFKHVQASVFQVARAPGKKVVYLGCALLILGIFAMLYIRERRLWVWLAPTEAQDGDEQAKATMALSTNRKTMDGDREFEKLREKLLGIKKDTPT